MGKKVKIASLLFASGLLLNLANTHLWIFLVCISIIPLFIILNNCPKNKSLPIGFIFGMGIGTGMFSWMVDGVSHYTGNGAFYGFLVCIISSIFLGFYFAILSWLTKILLISNTKSNNALLLNRICIGAVWTVLESGMAILLESFPLHYFRLGFPFVTNVFAIQLTAIGGLGLLTFLTVLINLFMADFFIQKKKFYLIYGFSVFSLLFIRVAVILYTYTPSITGKPFKVAIVSDNTNPETKWNNENGNTFATNYFQLCRDAVALEPDFIIWPETALPWTYSPDDDLLKEIIKISSNHDLTHVIGINNENSTDKKLYNSVFYINNQNKVTATYSKQILLKGIEEPLGKFLVPFLSQDGFILSKGQSQQPIQTRFGKAGNLICNEVVLENSGAEQVRNGANFLFNFSNDSWFKDNYISDLHFYYARLQAVENRKDISIANNCGINAIISSNGSIISQKKETIATVLSGMIQPNDNLSFFTKYPVAFPIFLMLFLSIYLLTLKIQIIRNNQNLKI